MKNQTSKPASQTGRYFKYAIGEIILVVIGILIALQINNWNENRKLKQLTDGIYSTIKSDLEADIAKTELFLNYYDSVRKPLFLSFLRDELIKEEVIKNPSLQLGFRGWDDIRISTRGYELLKNLPSISNSNQSLANKIADFYNTHLYEIEIAQIELAQEFLDNNLHFKRKGFTWSYVMGRHDENFIEYYLYDDDAKNRMAAYYLFFNIYTNELRNFKGKARSIIDSINTDLND
ncbi:DUF6090 family protein [Winogradskyella aurantia]|nr:DUF6090 family protein [Winogradskyella aurantia]